MSHLKNLKTVYFIMFTLYFDITMIFLAIFQNIIYVMLSRFWYHSNYYLTLSIIIVVVFVVVVLCFRTGKGKSVHNDWQVKQIPNLFLCYFHNITFIIMVFWKIWECFFFEKSSTYKTNSCMFSSVYRIRKIGKATISFVMSVRLSVCTHDTTWLPQDRFPRNLIFFESM